MKNASMLLAATLLVGSMVLAADAENKETATVDHSKNPITGTKTTTKKYKGKMKDEKGHSEDVSVTEKTKVKKDGTTTHSVDASGESTEKH
jgi:hypothetical protein